jgi:hypothetical protein
MNERIKLFDFYRQEYFSKDDFLKIKEILNGLEEYLAISLKKHFGKSISFNSLEIEQYELQEFTISLPNPTYLSVFEIEPLQNKGLLEIDLNFLKDLTNGNFEYKQVADLILDTMQDLFQKYLKIQFKHIYYSQDEINTKEISLYEPTEICLLISIKYNSNQEEHAINIILPYFDLFYFSLPLMKMDKHQLKYCKFESKIIDLKDKLLILLNTPEIKSNKSLNLDSNKEFIWRNFTQDEQAKIVINGKFIGTGLPVILENESKGIRIDSLNSKYDSINDQNLSYLNENIFLLFGETKINPVEEIKLGIIYELNQKFWEPPILIESPNKQFPLKIIQCNNNSYVRILSDLNKELGVLIKNSF